MAETWGLAWVDQTETVDAEDKDVVRALEANDGWRLLHVGMGKGGQTTLTYGWPWPGSVDTPAPEDTEPERMPVPDLMAALERSLEEARRARG